VQLVVALVSSGDVPRRGVGCRVAAGRFRCDISEATQSSHPGTDGHHWRALCRRSRRLIGTGGDQDHSRAVVDAGWTDRVAAARELWTLRDRYATKPPRRAISPMLAAFDRIGRWKWAAQPW